MAEFQPPLEIAFALVLCFGAEFLVQGGVCLPSVRRWISWNGRICKAIAGLSGCIHSAHGPHTWREGLCDRSRHAYRYSVCSIGTDSQQTKQRLRGCRDTKRRDLGLFYRRPLYHRDFVFRVNRVPRPQQGRTCQTKTLRHVDPCVNVTFIKLCGPGRGNLHVRFT